jgi:hypothetical protein
MRVSLVKYEQIRNLGNYENQKVGVEIEVNDGESPAAAMEQARAIVMAALYPERQSKPKARPIGADADELPF